MLAAILMVTLCMYRPHKAPTWPERNRISANQLFICILPFAAHMKDAQMAQKIYKKYQLKGRVNAYDLNEELESNATSEHATQIHAECTRAFTPFCFLAVERTCV